MNRILALLLLLPMFVTSSLTTSYTGRPCPGEEVTLTCTVMGDVLTWESDNSFGQFIFIKRFAMVNDTNEGGPEGYSALVTSITPTHITSTLTISSTIISAVFNEAITVSCVNESVTILTAVPPSPLLNIWYSLESSSVEGASVTVGWDPPTVNGGRDNLVYTVTISPPAQLSAIVVTSTSVSVSANYSVDYTVSVVVGNCAGSSMAVGYTFTINPPVTCDPPSPPVNGSIVNETALPAPSVEGTRIYYTCDEGLFPSEDLPSVCGSDGVWSPNPGELVCRTEPFTCSLPAPPTGGFIVEISNSTVVFGCSEGFSPQENKTANCVAMNQWRPSPEQRVCVEVEATTDSATVSSTIGTLRNSVSTTVFVVSIMSTAVVFSILGLITGLLVKCLIIRKKIVHSPAKGQVQPPPAGPVYEEVCQEPKKEIELKSNQAYGPVAR